MSAFAVALSDSSRGCQVTNARGRVRGIIIILCALYCSPAAQHEVEVALCRLFRIDFGPARSDPMMDAPSYLRVVITESKEYQAGVNYY
jgi:hypothetical protein